MTEPPFPLARILCEHSPSHRIIDAGALLVGGSQGYARLLSHEMSRVIGFEPIVNECADLNRRFGPTHLYLPYALGDGRIGTFHRCNEPVTSSLLAPDLGLMAHFQNLPEFCRVVEQSTIKTVRLDDIPEARGADFFKIDTQGAELQILENSRECLHTILAIQTEVEFLPIYRHQPLFGDVDAFLRSEGFLFHKFVDFEGRVLRDVPIPDLPATRSQVLWADAVYIRSIDQWDALVPEDLLKLAAILHELYSSLDFCVRLLSIFDQKKGTALAPAYVHLISNR